MTMLKEALALGRKPPLRSFPEGGARMEVIFLMPASICVHVPSMESAETSMTSISFFRGLYKACHLEEPFIDIVPLNLSKEGSHVSPVREHQIPQV